MTVEQASRMVDICIPPALAEDALKMAADNCHPAWSKGHQRGKYFIVSTDSLDDMSEMADFARVSLEDPDHTLSKNKRAACQALLDRTHRHAVLEPLGDIHCLAVAWRDKPLKGSKGSRVVTELRKASSDSPTFRYPRLS